jgi:hypothetical protein
MIMICHEIKPDGLDPNDSLSPLNWKLNTDFKSAP